MYKFNIMEISKEDALFMIQKYHYSNTLPKLNKCFVGFYLDNRLVGVVTLGWGTRPRHTIKRIFPSLDTKDYFDKLTLEEQHRYIDENKYLNEYSTELKYSNRESTSREVARRADKLGRSFTDRYDRY